MTMMFISSEKRSCFSPKYAAPIVLMVHLAANIFTARNASLYFILIFFFKKERRNIWISVRHRRIALSLEMFLLSFTAFITPWHWHEMVCSRLSGCERSKIEKLTFELTIFPIPTSKQLPAISVGKFYLPLKRQSAKLLVGFLSGFLLWANRQVP